MKPKVLVTRNIPREDLTELFLKCDVDYHDSNETLSREELLKRVKKIDGLLCVSVRANEELMESAPNLKVISNYGVGYDKVDVEAATRREIVVTNTSYRHFNSGYTKGYGQTSCREPYNGP